MLSRARLGYFCDLLGFRDALRTACPTSLDFSQGGVFYRAFPSEGRGFGDLQTLGIELCFCAFRANNVDKSRSGGISRAGREMMLDQVPILLAEDDRNDIFLMRKAFEKAGIPNPLFVVHNGQE